MSDGINAGLILTSQFIQPGNEKFKTYINYIDRDSAVRNTNEYKFMIKDVFGDYINYMDNPHKTTELFTNSKDVLTLDEKEELKNQFEKAQNNNSLMWQTVLSFDNKWLAQNGLYDPETNSLDERRLQDYARGGINKMLEKEKLKDTALWSGAIHYNTDNIHIHIAIVEPTPTRKTKEYKKIQIDNMWLREQGFLTESDCRKIEINKGISAYKNKEPYGRVLNNVRKEILKQTNEQMRIGNFVTFDKDYNLIISYQGDIDQFPPMVKLKSKSILPDGRFKNSSFESAKSYMVNKITDQQLTNTRINSIIRDSIVKGAKESPILQDSDLMAQFIELHTVIKQLTPDHRRWQYNENTISALKPKIDALSQAYIERYYPHEFNEIQELLTSQNENYKQAYGTNSNSNFIANKNKDLYTRMGNTILKELKQYDNDIRKESYDKRQKQFEKAKRHRQNSYLRLNFSRSLESVSYRLKKALLADFTYNRNLQAYNQLQKEIEDEERQ